MNIQKLYLENQDFRAEDGFQCMLFLTPPKVEEQASIPSPLIEIADQQN